MQEALDDNACEEEFGARQKPQESSGEDWPDLTFHSSAGNSWASPGAK